MPVYKRKKPLINPEMRRRGIYLLPNLFTTAALFAGFYAIVQAMNARFEQAAVAIFIAMVLDGLDGRVARLTHTQSEFGAEYDSLTDMVSFGAAPAQYPNAAIHPRPASSPPSSAMSRSAHSYITSAGAAPKETMSVRLSYSAPNADCVRVSRATRPSMLSSTIATKIAIADFSNSWFMPCTIA